MLFRAQHVVLLLLLLPAAVSNTATAQEVLLPMKYNYQLIDAELPGSHRALNDTLPFIDDFSYPAHYPDPDKWINNYAFVNSTYPVNPPTIGVATFDGLSSDGTPHAPGGGFGSADTLTSVALKLAQYNAASNVHLSFYYQARGLGNKPEDTDSLVLEFLNSDTTWTRIWAITVDSIVMDSFYRFDLHISDVQYLHDDFQFRFRNYADRRGNNDHWHIDYVFIDENRSASDPLNDVGFTTGGHSLLSLYSAMPLNQFQGFEGMELRDTLTIRMRNNFDVNKNVNYRFVAVEDCTPTQFHTQNIGVIGNFLAQSDSLLHEPNYNAQIATLSQSTLCDSLTITTTYIQDSLATDINFGNDTTTHHQVFQNYFAYDDGSAEAAYGVIGTGSLVAYKFRANKADTLRAVQVHFAHVDEDVSNLLFSLIVWDSVDLANGSGDNILYRQDFQTPVYVDSLNGFYTYFLDTPKVVSGNFWVGWQQGQQNNLGIGYDLNNDAGQHTFINLTGTWSQSVLNGAMMIRPLLGAPFVISTIEPVTQTALRVFPNPSSGLFFVEGLKESDRIQLYDLSGRQLRDMQYSKNGIDLSMLSAGVYLLRATDGRGKRIAAQRIIKLNP